jgi:ATP-dependent RNA helicase RhlE
VPNFYTKTNLLNQLLLDKESHHKVLVFVATKVNADRLSELLNLESEVAVIHSSKEQNHRTKSIEKFEDGTSRVLIATDVIARGIDIDKISTVISFDTPFYPENYMHRIGRTARAEQKGKAILFFTEKENELKKAIEDLMNYSIPLLELPQEVEISSQLTHEEKNKPIAHKEIILKKISQESGASFHEKLSKNKKQNIKRKSLKERFKKPIRRGDKIQNLKKKNKKK